MNSSGRFRAVLGASFIKGMRIAASHGAGDARSGFALFEGHGTDTQQNYSEAAKWYRKAAEQGHVEAQVLLSIMHYQGRGVPHDYAEAAKWMRKAADQGHVDAAVLLSVMYYQGRGVPQDHAEAAKWMRKAADQGHVDAQSIVDRMQARGDDEANASEALRKAADAGDADAQYILGFICDLQSTLGLVSAGTPGPAEGGDPLRKADDDGEAEPRSGTAPTGVHNRHNLLARLDEEVLRALRYDRALCCVMVALDQHARLGEEGGRTAGEAMLRAVGTHLRTTLRSTDIVGRYGGEKFLVILPKLSLSEATLVARKLRREVESLAIDIGAGTTTNPTVHLGTAELTARSGQAGTDARAAAAALLKDTEEAMYQSKAQERRPSDAS